MTHKMLSIKHNKSLALTVIILLSTGCANMLEKKSTPFDTSQVSGMHFQFENDSRILGLQIPKEDIVPQVTKNLAEWGYVFTSKESNEYTHDLMINVGSIQKGSTPVGFSFTAGNSDPRALEFQKAQVLPMTCSLIPKDQNELRAELVMEVMVDSFLTLKKNPVKFPQLIDQLTEDISTTCFNLLSSLRINTLPVADDVAEKSIAPKWMPEIRIEIENDLEVDASTATDTPSTSGKNIIKAPPRKRIIIHNKGNPVIFKFGHERK